MHNEAVVFVIGKERVLEYWSQGNQLQFYLEKTLKIVQCHPQLDGIHIKATIISCSWIGIRNREIRNIRNNISPRTWLGQK